MNKKTIHFTKDISLSKNNLSPKTNPSDNIVSDVNEKDTEKSEIFVNKKD